MPLAETYPMPQDQNLDPFDLVALLGSRLCHDLISPMGAIANGVELLEMAGGRSPELELIAQSVAAANARLKFFRVAFGQASAEQRLGGPEILALLAEMSGSGRLKYRWEAAGDQARRDVKHCFLALLCLEAALPWGGTVEIARAERGWVLRAEGARVKADPELWGVLSGAEKTLAPAQVHFGILAGSLRAQGRAAQWRVEEGLAEIVF